MVMKRTLLVVFILLFLLLGCAAEEEKVEIYTEPKPIVTPSCGGDEQLENVLVVDLESPPTLQIITYHDERYDDEGNGPEKIRPCQQGTFTLQFVQPPQFH